MHPGVQSQAVVASEITWRAASGDSTDLSVRSHLAHELPGRDVNDASGVNGYITRYQPGVATLDMAQVGSTDPFAGGFGYVVSSQITETVNNTLYAYTLIGWPEAASTANQICGLRVAYYAPSSGLVFMPAVKR